MFSMDEFYVPICMGECWKTAWMNSQNVCVSMKNLGVGTKIPPFNKDRRNL